ncbi:cytochrome c oxidase assembly protein [Aureimonas sp. AU40]|uniref:cytochrome c oxidase assembly protein n=1 Tax=Aureimonas sp. AU40 TaxID=1637747 RepID=UPI000AE71A62|nr:cytochrome c oxidase assembly protein [Aureimonas sp. AU40]
MIPSRWDIPPEPVRPAPLGRKAWMRRHAPLALALLVLVAAWFGPLPARAETSFAAHMILHMGVVALAAPLLAFGLARSRLLPAGAGAGRFVLPAALLEFLLIWGWHAPALHDAARQSLALFALEQASFLLAGLFLWTAALGSLGSQRTGARAAGAAGLLLTSMHMTLLGALLLLAPRPLYRCGTLCSPLATLTPLEDQQLGGTLMLAVGGAAYLAGGIALLAGVLNTRPAEARP